MRVGIAQQANGLRLAPEAMHHRRHDVVRRVDAGELIGVGKEIAFESLGVRIDVAQQESIALAPR